MGIPSSPNSMAFLFFFASFSLMVIAPIYLEKAEISISDDAEEKSSSSLLSKTWLCMDCSAIWRRVRGSSPRHCWGTPMKDTGVYLDRSTMSESHSQTRLWLQALGMETYLNLHELR